MPKPEEDVDPGHARPFADFLRDHARGNTHDELSERLRDLVQRVNETGRKGSLTLTVFVEPVKNSDGTALAVSDKLVLKMPEFSRPASLFYTDDSGNLTRSDPHQLTFEGLREVPNDDPIDVTQLKEVE